MKILEIVKSNWIMIVYLTSLVLFWEFGLMKYWIVANVIGAIIFVIVFFKEIRLVADKIEEWLWGKNLKEMKKDGEKAGIKFKFGGKQLGKWR